MMSLIEEDSESEFSLKLFTKLFVIGIGMIFDPYKAISNLVGQIQKILNFSPISLSTQEK